MPLGLHTAALNFETLSEIGQEGKNSNVFIAHDKQLDGEIVVKRIAKAKIEKAEEYYRESKILHAAAHSNVVRINYGCSDEEFIFIAMPYYQNGSLKKRINKGHLTIREVVRYSIQFLSGLNFIHSKGLIHFDVKPDNILISDSDEALLSDFGLAKALNQFGYAEPDLVYEKQVPPELFTGDYNTTQYDIYLAGLTIYRIANGNDHFNQQFNFKTQEDYIDALKAGRFPDRNSYLPHVPLKLRKAVNKALSVNTMDRHTSVIALMNDLSSVDTNLDWRMTSAGSENTWSRSDSERSYLVTHDLNLGRILTTKTMVATGRTTKVIPNCHSSLSPHNYRQHLTNAFKL